jgi:hypothetical protein
MVIVLNGFGLPIRNNDGKERNWWVIFMGIKGENILLGK